MKRFVLLIFTTSLFIKLQANTYYSQGSLAPNLTSSWNTNRLGGGATPANFSGAGDIFVIQNGHTMTTSATWSLGGSTAKLQIESGGVLVGANTIQLPGTSFIFQIDNGGKYIHNNTNSVATTGGASIWSGTETFAANSTVEIQRWINNTTTLIAGVSWGNLNINVTVSIGGNWNQNGNLTTIQGNLQIISTGTGVQEFRITGAANTTLNIAGNLVIDGGIFNLKSSSSTGTSCIAQVNGNISVNAGTLNTGTADVVPSAELLFKGNFTAVAGTVTSGDDVSYLVANGTSAQTLSCIPVMNCNFLVAGAAMVNLTSALSVTANKTFSIEGTFNQNSSMNVAGRLETAGGTFNSNASFTVGTGCTACTGDGTYSGSSWCSLSGNKGTINFTNHPVFLDNNISATFFSAGSFTVTSPGDIYFVNSVATTSGSGFGVNYNNKAGSVFSLDANSYVAGLSSIYSGEGGTLRIGSANGITTSGSSGNVRTATRNYNQSGINSFEYFGSNPQVTGNGLPATIDGTLRIDNSAGISSMGVTLTNSTTINGFLDLDDGKLRTSASSLITISAIGNFASYGPTNFIGGPLRVIGHPGFTFPIGINAASAPTGTIYAPIVMNNVSGTNNATDSYTAEYIRGNPQSAISTNIEAPINHISFVEYWSFLRTDGGTNTPVKQIVLEVNPESICYNLSTLLVARYNGTIWKNEGTNGSPIPLGSSPPLVWGKLFSNNTIANVSGYYTLSTTDQPADNPLPIRLISFDAIKVSPVRSSVTWELGAVCSPAAKFEVQRAASDRNFVGIGTINASTTSRLYDFTDNELKKGVNYYRLKMTDEDSKTSYSRTVAVMNGINGLLFTSLVPTIVAGNATVTIASSRPQKFDMMIMDMQGRAVRKHNYAVMEGNTSIEFSVENLAAGVYQLIGITEDGKTNAIRFIKQ